MPGLLSSFLGNNQAASDPYADPRGLLGLFSGEQGLRMALLGQAVGSLGHGGSQPYNPGPGFEALGAMQDRKLKLQERKKWMDASHQIADKVRASNPELANAIDGNPDMAIEYSKGALNNVLNPSAFELLSGGQNVQPGPGTSTVGDVTTDAITSAPKVDQLTTKMREISGIPDLDPGEARALYAASMQHGGETYSAVYNQILDNRNRAIQAKLPASSLQEYNQSVADAKARGEKPQSYDEWFQSHYFGKASATAEGTAVGGAAGELGPATVAATQTVQEIDKLLANPDLASATGGIQGNIPGAVLSVTNPKAFAVRQTIEQLKGKAFMDAYATLKGGGQITEIEGQKATDALARMNTAQSDSDYRLALTDFRDAIQVGLAKLAARARKDAPQMPAPQMPVDTSQLPDGTTSPKIRKWNPETGDFE